MKSTLIHGRKLYGYRVNQHEYGYDMTRKQYLNPDQYPLIVPESNWRPPSSLPPMEEILASPVLSLDTETSDPDLSLLGPSWFRGGWSLAGISLAWYAGNEIRFVYLPVGHRGGDNLDKTMVLSFVRELLRRYTGRLVGMNMFYDLGCLKMENIGYDFDNAANGQHPWDVMMAAALLDEHALRYNLNSIADDLQIPRKDEQLLREAAVAYGLDPKKDLALLPARYAGPYAERDAVMNILVYEKQLPQIVEQRLERVIKLEHDLIPMLIEMRFSGVRVDVKKAEELLGFFEKESEDYRQEIKRLTGYLPDIWVPDSCAVALDKMKIPYSRTTTGKPSITDDWMAEFPEKSVPWLINQARKSYKAGHTFCRGMVLDHVTKNGRIHSEFHPLRSDDGGTVSGRFSSSHPNLQQVPKREPRMNTLIRGLFLPEEGELWCAADYSQQEPRLTVHYAEELGCKRGAEVAERYRTDPNTDYHNLVAELVFGSGFTPAQRKIAKNINLGLAYGMGGAKLCRKLGLPTMMKENSYSGKSYEAAGPEGQKILDQYHASVPFVRELSKYYSEIAKNTGETRTLSGRRCRYPYWEPRNGGRAMLKHQAAMTYGASNIRRAFTHAALNRKIQGGSADMIKIALRDLWREKIIPKVTVHDENGVSVKNPQEARRIAEIMGSCIKLRVPLKVEVEIGATWGLAKPITEEDE